MIKISPKTDAYLADAKSSINLLRFKKLIRVLPTVVLFILGIIICIVTSSPIPLIINALALIYVLVITFVLSKLFIKYNAEVTKKYIEHYKFAPHAKEAVATGIKEDNKMVYAKINLTGKVNGLFCWKQDNELHLISSGVISISRMDYKTTTVAQYQEAIDKDFGKLVISIDDIDYYKDETLGCKFKNSVLKFIFINNTAFDRFIPTRDFYYNSEKKSDSFGDYKA